MVKTIIEAFPKKKRLAAKDGSPVLFISECFSDTIQGENCTGYPATFLRLKGCTLSCKYCDTSEVWRKGNPYSVLELIKLWDINGVIDKFMDGQHLVLTGGSPLLQQESLCVLIDTIVEEYGFKPILEIENECIIMPSHHIITLIDCWNNSPKLTNSGNDSVLIHNKKIIEVLSMLKNCWFKFVISSKEDWEEIERDYITPGLIDTTQIVLMPEGCTREQLQKNYQMVVDLAVEHSVKFTDRLQVTIWNKTLGV